MMQSVDQDINGLPLDVVTSWLKSKEEGTDRRVVNLLESTFSKDGENVSLQHKNEIYALSPLAQRQFCQRLGIPFSFFKRASDELDRRAVAEFMPALSPDLSPDEDRGVDSTLALLPVRKLGGDRFHARALLPEDYTPLSNLQVWDSIVGSVDPAKVRVVKAPFLSSKEEVPFMHLRLAHGDGVFSVGETEEDGVAQEDTLYMGSTITFSELGAAPLQISSSMARVACFNFTLMKFGRGPFFNFSYHGPMGRDLKTLVADGIVHAMNSLSDAERAVQEATHFPVDARLVKIWIQILRPRLSKGIIQKMMGRLTEKPARTKWDFVNALTAQARSFNPRQQLQYEGAAGEVLGLVKHRSAEDESLYVDSGFKAFSGSEDDLTLPNAA